MALEKSVGTISSSDVLVSEKAHAQKLKVLKTSEELILNSSTKFFPKLQEQRPVTTNYVLSPQLRAVLEQIDRIRPIRRSVRMLS